MGSHRHLTLWLSLPSQALSDLHSHQSPDPITALGLATSKDTYQTTHPLPLQLSESAAPILQLSSSRLHSPMAITDLAQEYLNKVLGRGDREQRPHP